jgi:hypothetical protein
MSASDVAAWAALGVSVVAVYLNLRAQGRTNGLQERIVHVEEAREADRVEDALRASLVASIRRADDFRWAVKIRNGGRSEARDILVTLDGKPIREWPNHTANDPVVLSPDGEFEYSLAVPEMNVPYPRIVEVTWTDDSGVSGQSRSSIGMKR